MSPKPGELLSTINSPSDLKKLNEGDLVRLCGEIRSFIIDVISSNPGHLGASLGAVELAVALHYVFDTPDDKVIWDVGHQAYAHKILTGRRDVFYTNRTYNGISGFPRMSESEYDAFGVGHSSTSISAALGMAIASRLTHNPERQHIAVIGDGAMTGGMATEALNNAGVSQANILVILNDNGIAIDQNVGAMKEYLTNIVASPAYNKLRDRVWNLLGGGKYGKNSRALVKQIGNALKSSILKRSNLFEAFGFRYFGPVDGHDVIRLVKLLRDLKRIQGPKLLHIITTKGKGYKHAEKDQTTFHAPGQFNKETGEILQAPCKGKIPPRYQVVFGKTLVELAEKNPKIVGVTPAMATGCSMDLMMARMPERVFDVGIAEQHAVTFAAGLASQGLIPFCNIYSTFAQRAYDQIIHDAALQKLHVVLCLDRGGLVGEDGATHHGLFDLAYLRAIPGIVVCAPMNEQELRNMMYTSQTEPSGLFAIRYPRGRGVMPEWKTPLEALPVGKGRRIREGKDLAILSLGHPGNDALEACGALDREGIQAALYDFRFLKPIDEDLLHEVFRNFNKVITVEDGTVVGGFGSAVLEFSGDKGFESKVVRLGVQDYFPEQGTLDELRHECGFDAAGIVKAVKALLLGGE